MKLKSLDLCAGIGGLSLGLSDWTKTVAFYEISPFCQKVLAKNFPGVPVRGDLREASEQVDILMAGFPCQDISVAGKKAGIHGKRSGLFFDICTLACRLDHPFLFFENVAAICERGGREVLTELAAMGYDAVWGIVPASSAGSPQKRERWFLLAYPNGQRCHYGCNHRTRRPFPVHLLRNDSSHIEEWGGLQPIPGETLAISQTGGEDAFTTYPLPIWNPEPEVVRVVDGLPANVDSVAALGNSACPQQVRLAFKLLVEQIGKR